MALLENSATHVSVPMNATACAGPVHRPGTKLKTEIIMITSTSTHSTGANGTAAFHSCLSRRQLMSYYLKLIFGVNIVNRILLKLECQSERGFGLSACHLPHQKLASSLVLPATPALMVKNSDLGSAPRKASIKMAAIAPYLTVAFLSLAKDSFSSELEALKRQTILQQSEHNQRVPLLVRRYANNCILTRQLARLSYRQLVSWLTF